MPPDPPPQKLRERLRHDDQTRKRLTELNKLIGDQLQALQSGQDWTDFLNVAARFPDQDFRNTLLIQNQRPTATILADYDTWQSHGRQVTKGEHGITIITPTAPPPAPAPGQPAATRPPPDTFTERPSVLFDISQTNGGPPPRATPPPLQDGVRPGAWNALAEVALRRGYYIERTDPGEQPVTHWIDRRIRIPSDLDGAPAVMALAHELGHVLLHDPANLPFLDKTAPPPIPATTRCSGTLAVEAESIAFLVTARLGMDTTGFTFPPLSIWAGADQRAPRLPTIRNVTDRILHAATRINAHLDVYLPAPMRGPQPTPSIDQVNEDPQPGPTQDPEPEQRQQPEQEPAPSAAPSLPGPAPTTEPPSRPSSTPGTPPPQRTPRPERTRTPEDRPPEPPAELVRELLDIHEKALAYFERHMVRSWAPDYLNDRGFGTATQLAWHIGYATPGWTDLVDHLRGLGYADKTIEMSGLAFRSKKGKLLDYFRNRVMLPIRDADNKVVAFIGRISDADKDDTRKYLNSPNTPIYRKGAILFGLGEQRAALKAGKLPVLVEGPFDVIAVNLADQLGAGRYVGLAPCGTALTADQVTALSTVTDLDRTGVLVALDPDEGGRRAAPKAFDLLDHLARPLNAADLPKDPADIVRHQNPMALAQALRDQRRPLTDFIVDIGIEAWDRRYRADAKGTMWPPTRIPGTQQHGTTGRGAIRDIAPLIAQMALNSNDPLGAIERQISRQISRLADRLNLNHEDVAVAVAQALSPGQVSDITTVVKDMFVNQRPTKSQRRATAAPKTPALIASHVADPDNPAPPTVGPPDPAHATAGAGARPTAAPKQAARSRH